MKKLLAIFVLAASAHFLNAQTAVPEPISLPDVEMNLENVPMVKKEIKFPALKKVNGYIPVLRATIYYKMTNPSGWTSCGVMKLNGKPFNAKTAKKQFRLLRRGEFMICNFGKKDSKVPYYRGNNLLVFFGPGRENAVDKRIVSPREEGYRYYFDISDLVSDSKENTLFLGSLLQLKVMKNRNTPLNFRDMKIMYIKESEAAKLRK